MKKLWTSPFVLFLREAIMLYFSRRVPQAAACLAYFVLLTVFPVLICVSYILGMVNIDIVSLMDQLQPLLPEAALDVLEQESGLYYADLKTVPIPNHDLALLKAFPNVIVTPHTAFYTEEAVEHMVAGTVKGLLACEQGGVNPYLVQG